MIKSYLRFAMSESRLSTLGILSTESEFIKKLDFRHIIFDLASRKLIEFNLSNS